MKSEKLSLIKSLVWASTTSMVVFIVFFSGHYLWPKVETVTIEKKEEGVSCISKLEDGRVLKNYSTECSEVMWVFEKAQSDYASLQSERQKFACEKANGKVKKVSLDLVMEITVCTTLEGVYKWNGDKFILEKEL